MKSQYQVLCLHSVCVWKLPSWRGQVLTAPLNANPAAPFISSSFHSLWQICCLGDVFPPFANLQFLFLKQLFVHTCWIVETGLISIYFCGNFGKICFTLMETRLQPTSLLLYLKHYSSSYVLMFQNFQDLVSSFCGWEIWYSRLEKASSFWICVCACARARVCECVQPIHQSLCKQIERIRSQCVRLIKAWKHWT